MEWLNWIMENKTTVIACIGSIVTTASIIVKITPTPEDDKWLAKVVKILNALALNPKK